MHFAGANMKIYAAKNLVISGFRPEPLNIQHISLPFERLDRSDCLLQRRFAQPRLESLAVGELSDSHAGKKLGEHLLRFLPY